MKNKRNIIIYFVVFLFIILVAFLVLNKRKDNLIKLSSSQIIEKIGNKESFVLCISQTTCSHCVPYKPKLRKIANKYNIKIYYTDVDLYNNKESKNLSKYIYYNETPTTIFFVGGDEKTTANRLSGNVSTDKIIEKLKKLDFIK